MPHQSRGAWFAGGLTVLLLSGCGISEEGRATLQLAGPAAEVNLRAWKDLNRQLAPDGRITVPGPGGDIVVTTSLNGHRTEDLMDALAKLPEGRRTLAWSGVHRVGVAYISDRMWTRFQDRLERAGLPRPPELEPGYDLRLDDGAMVLLIREGFEDDWVTLLREADYTAPIRLFYETGVAVSPEVDHAFERYLDEVHPGAEIESRRRMRDLLVRLYGNLRSRRTLRLCETQGGCRIDSYYRRQGLVAGDAEFNADLRQSLEILFRNDWRDVYYYGAGLFDVQVPEGMGLGGPGEDALHAWIEKHVDLGALVERLDRSVPDDLNEAFRPLLQPRDARYYSAMPFFPRDDTRDVTIPMFAL